MQGLLIKFEKPIGLLTVDL